MKKICENCKYYTYKKSDYKQDKYPMISECSCLKFEIGYSSNLEDIDNDGVLVEGDEGWGFMPNKKFGCIHFKKK